MFNVKKLKISMLIVGIVSIALSAAVFFTDVGSYESNEYYGGDAYTGIQQAAAQTANNVQDVGEMIRLGVGGLLLVEGLAFLCGACCLSVEKKRDAHAMPPSACNLREDTCLEGIKSAEESSGTEK